MIRFSTVLNKLKVMWHRHECERNRTIFSKAKFCGTVDPLKKKRERCATEFLDALLRFCLLFGKSTMPDNFTLQFLLLNKE